jgi:hypothetical protein
MRREREIRNERGKEEGIGKREAMEELRIRRRGKRNEWKGRDLNG